MAGNKKHGYRRGNASGRTKSIKHNDWFCNGCKKSHAYGTFRNGLNGFSYYDKEYFKIKSQQGKQNV